MIGSAPVAIPLLVVLAIRDALVPRSELTETPPEPEIRGRVDAVAVDAVRDLPDGRLEILSLLPKPHWGARSAIHYRDAWWALHDREELPPEPAPTTAPRWRFVLAPWPEHMVVQDPQEYVPEEVRGIAFDAARDRHRATVETLAPLFGLLPPAPQRRLAEVYGHDPRSATGWSLVLVALPSAAAGVTAASRMLGEAGDAADVAIALVSLALLAETAARAVAWLRGDVSASVLAGLVRPLAARVLNLGPES